MSDRFVLLVQRRVCSMTRVRRKVKHTAWAYCHVPEGSQEDMTEAIEAQVERFAPGFRDCVLARRASGATALAEWNPNLAGGDVSGGAMTLGQLLARPTLRNYRTSNDAVYLCIASSTPPGGGVHGMCGYFAALAAVARSRVKAKALTQRDAKKSAKVAMARLGASLLSEAV